MPISKVSAVLLRGFTQQILVIATAVFVTTPSRAQLQPPVALPAGATYVTSVESINEYRLPNGLRVLLFVDPSKANVAVNIAYMVGSRHENYGEGGMAHLLEHLTFKGTPRHPDIWKELKEHSTQHNGMTSYDRTNYWETFPATDKNLSWALDLEADRMVNSFIAKKDLDSEMTVVRNEFELRENSHDYVLQKRTFSAAFHLHNYGNPVIGSRSDIERVPIERLQAFYRHFYQPDNAVLVVAGKIDEEKTLALVAQYFSPIPKPTRTLRRTYTSEPTQDGERIVTLRRIGEVQALNVMYHIPAGTHAEYPAVEMAASILGTAPSGRLHKALVETGLAVSGYSYSHQLRDPGVMVAGAMVRKEKSLDDALNATLATIEDLKSRPFTDEELTRARTEFLNYVDRMLNDTEKIAHALTEWQAMGDWRMLFLHRDRGKAVTREQAEAAAQKYFVASNRTVGKFIPEAVSVRAEIPETQDLADLLKDYHGDATIAKSEAFDASPENIDRRTERIDLPGGVKLSLLSKKPRGEQVHVSIRFEFGDENSLRGLGTVADITGSLLMRGSSRHTRQQIEDELGRLKAEVWAGAWAGGAWLSLRTTRENLAPVLNLVAEILKEPAFPGVEFAQLIQESLATAEAQKSDPSALASRALRRFLNEYPADDVRYLPTLNERIAELRSLTSDQAKMFHRGFFGASDFNITVVGDFDPTKLRRQVTELFSSWKSPKPYARVTQKFAAVGPRTESIQTPDKANANWEAALKIKMTDADADYPAMVLGTYILGGGVGSRLMTRIRGKEGLSFRIGAAFSARTEDDDARFTAFATCAPENAPKVEASFKDELAKILAEGYTVVEVDVAKTSWLQSRQMSRANDWELAGRLNLLRRWGRTMAGYDADLDAKVSKVTPADVQAAMRKHIDLSQLSIVRAGDFKKAGVTWNTAEAAPRTP